MDFRQYRDLVAIKANDSHVWGFHAYNLDIFELTHEAWGSLAAKQQTQPLQEIKDALAELATDVVDVHPTCGQLQIDELSLNVAQICNLKCVYCAAGGDGTYGQPTSRLNLDEARKQIQFFIQKKSHSSSRNLNIRFLGGEPLLHPEIIRELCEFAQATALPTQVEVTFSTTTNGTLIDNSIADMLAKFKFSVTLSLDGADDINNKARPTKNKSGPSSTQSTLDGLRHLLRVRPELTSLNVNTVFGAHNIDVLSTYKFLKEIYADWSEINFLYNYDESDPELNKKFIAAMSATAEFAYNMGGLDELIRIKQFSTPLSRIVARTRHHSYCGAGKSLLQSDARGNLYTCNWFMNDKTESLGRIAELSENTTPLDAYKKSLIELNNCQTCWARHLCGGGCMAYNKARSGDRHKKDTHFCDRTRALAAVGIHYLADFYLKGEQL